MKSNFRISLSTMLIILISAIPIKGATMSADQLYAQAFSATNNAISDRSQKSINIARSAIDALRGTGAAWAIGEFSKQVDQLQQPMLVKIIDAITNAQNNPTQANVNAAKAAVDPDLIVIWRNSYNSAIDKIEQGIINYAVSAYNKALQSKDSTDIKVALAKINEIKTSTDSNVANWANSFNLQVIELAKANGIDVNEVSNTNVGHADISLVSTSQLANSSDLYTVDGTGQYSGYKILKGYPNENKFQVYYKGDINSYSVSFQDLRGINVNEVVTWTYNGITYKNTKSELYKFFSDGTWLKSQLGVSGGTMSEEWFQKVFGSTYAEWFEAGAYSADAETLVEKYFEKTGQSGVINNVTLTPDSQYYEIKTDYIVIDGDTYFQAYDKQGKLLGKYSDGYDNNLIMAKLEGLKELPPKLSEGWINTDLLHQIYGFEIKEDGNDLVFQTNPIVTKHQEFLRLKLPNGWLTDDTVEAKVNGVSLKKYIIEDSKLNSEWIDRDTLDKEYGIYCGIGASINDFKLYSPYDSNTVTKSVLFTGTWPAGWQKNKDQIETDVNGLRIKREGNLDYFNVRDLQKLKVLPNSKLSRVIYLNIKDLKEIGLIN